MYEAPWQQVVAACLKREKGTRSDGMPDAIAENFSVEERLRRAEEEIYTIAKFYLTHFGFSASDLTSRRKIP